MAEEMDNINNTPKTTDAGVDNGAVLDPYAKTGNPELDKMNARILELQEQRDVIKDELRQLIFEREHLAAGEVWNKKLDGLNDAELMALEEALQNRQNVGVNGIRSREGVNGQQKEIE